MLEDFEHLEIENPHFIFGGDNYGYWGRDHGNSEGIPPDDAS